MLKLIRLGFIVALLLGVSYYALVRYTQQIPLQIPDEIYTVTAGSSAASLCRQWQQQHLLTQILTRYARPSQTTQKELQDALRRALGSVDARWLARTFPTPATA